MDKGPLSPQDSCAPRYVSSISKFQTIVTWITLFELGLLCGLEAVFVAVFSSSISFDYSYRHPQALQQGILTAAYPVSAAIGALLVLWISRYLLNKTLLVLSTYIWLAGYIVAVVAISFGGLLAARLLKGLAIGIITSVIPLYVERVFTPKQASLVLTAVQGAAPLGILLMSLLSTFIHGKKTDPVPFNQVWALAGIPAFPAVVLIMFMPPEDATRHVTMAEITAVDQPRRIYNINDVILRFFGQRPRPVYAAQGALPMISAVRDLRAILGNIRLRQQLYIAAFIQVTVQFTGINVVLYYLGPICRMIGLTDIEAAGSALGVYAVNLLGTLASMTTVSKMPRVSSLQYSGLAMGVVHMASFMLLLVGVRPDGTLNATMGRVALAFCFLFVLIFAFFFSGMSYIYTSEVVPRQYRTTSLGIAIAAGWLANAILSVLAPTVMSAIGITIFFVFFYFCICIFIWLASIDPEISPRNNEKTPKH